MLGSFSQQMLYFLITLKVSNAFSSGFVDELFIFLGGFKEPEFDKEG